MALHAQGPGTWPDAASRVMSGAWWLTALSYTDMSHHCWTMSEARQRRVPDDTGMTILGENNTNARS